MEALNVKRTAFVIIFFALLLSGITLVGCGKKRPPFTPRSIPLPVVMNLQADVQGSVVTLSWSLSQKGEGAAAGYFVHRSKTSLADADCLDCPVVFDKVADILAHKASSGQKETYSETLEKGVRYIYKVTVYTPDDDVGPDSNPVEIIH